MSIVALSRLAIVLPLLFLSVHRPERMTLIDHHQHLLSEQAVVLVPSLAQFTADDLIRLLDEAGVERAVVLSVAYQFGNPNRPPVADEYARVRAENDWTSRQVARFPGRLRGMCGVNPLREYAPSEIQRCAQDPHVASGIKLHFGNSDVDLDDTQHVARVRAVFRAANENGMAIVVHMRSSVTMRRPYGARQARVVVDLLASAPDVPVQIAHLAGAGDYADPTIDEALAVFIEAIAGDDPRMANVYFDVSSVARPGQSASQAELIATRIRQLGLERVLYGSDGAVPGNTPEEALARFRALPLTAAELRTIESNVAPYMR
jgi:predicted TIM-barrel fold metal-dependent hydrolase